MEKNKQKKLRPSALILCLSGILFLSACASDGSPVPTTDTILGPLRREGVKLVDVASGRPVFLKGLVYSPYLPGETGGEALPDDDRYGEHLALIRALGANLVSLFPERMPVGFFEALEQNDLWYVQVIDIRLYDGTDTSDLLATDYQEKVRRHIREVIDHTYAVGRPDRLAFFAIGYEVRPGQVAATARAHPTEGDFSGRYLSLRGQPPAEVALARLLENAMAYEEEKYGGRHLYTHIMHPGAAADPALPGFRRDDPERFFMDSGDLIAINLYPANFYLAADARRAPAELPLRSAYENYLAALAGLGEKPVVITEAGLTTARPLLRQEAVATSYGDNTPEDAAALYRRAWSDMKKANTNGAIAGFFWFEFLDEWWKNGEEAGDALTQNAKDPEEWFGLYTPETAASGTPHRLRPKEPLVTTVAELFLDYQPYGSPD